MKRITAIDTLKGLMLVVITVDHLGGPLKIYTWETFGFITATEGFVLLSGILAGIVYRRRIEQGLPLAHGIFKRIIVLYKYYLVPALAVALIFRLFPGNVGYAYYWKDRLWLFIDHPLRAMWQMIILQYQPGYFDILSLYILMTLLIPVVIIALKRKWLHWILAASFGLWLAAQFDIMWLHQLWHGAFDRSAWQLLFVIGMCVGYHHRAAKQRIVRTGGAMLTSLLVITLIFLAINHQWLPTPPFITADSIDRHYLGWARMLNFSIFAFLISWLAIRFPRLFSIKWLAFLGRYSLQVYVYSGLLVYFFQPMYPRLEVWGDNWWIVITLAAVASLSLPAWLHNLHHRQLLVDRIRTIARQWQKQISPAISEV